MFTGLWRPSKLQTIEEHAYYNTGLRLVITLLYRGGKICSVTKKRCYMYLLNSRIEIKYIPLLGMEMQPRGR